jgi:hypothetical protein
MPVRPEVVILLADVDIADKLFEVGGLPDKPIGEFIRESKHRDGRVVTEAEAVLIGSATPEEFEATARLALAEADYAQDLAAANQRFVAILQSAWDRLPEGSTADDALALLPPAERAEAEELAGRLFPDGYLYLGGGGPAV